MTDLAQGLILLIAGFLLFFLGLKILGGWEGFWSGLPHLHKLPFAPFNQPREFHFVGVFWQDGVANTFALYMMNQGFILRFLSLKSVKEIKKTFLALILILMPLATFAVSNAGWLGKAMHTHGLLPVDVNPEQIFVLVAGKVCVPGLFGFVMAALTAALMSTIDTLINAVSAIAVNDVYRPHIRRNATDKHYLRVARVLSLFSAILGIALVPVFASFKSIYLAHGSFTASITPPMVVTILLGAYWKKFTSSAAFWTLFGGSLVVALSIAWPVLITPFSHGVDPSGGFKYTRALYGLVGSLLIGVVVSCLTKAKSRDRVQGLVVGTLNKAKEGFKGAPINEIEGGKADVKIIPNSIGGELAVSPEVARRLAAGVGDVVHLSDARWWLGGLRSVQAKITSLHDLDPGVALVSPELIKRGSLIEKRKHRLEKIL
jgi:SSS family solute:Na+ symporter